MASNNPLTMLSNVSECSISGLFQELLNKGMKSPTTHTEPLKFGDSEGSDFKRLLHKKNHNNSNKVQITNAPTIDIITNSRPHYPTQDDSVSSKRRTFHHGSPDFRPVVYLDQQQPTRNNNRFGSAIYNFFFQHEDRYFNHDRDELSKDIFPVGYEQQRA